MYVTHGRLLHWLAIAPLVKQGSSVITYPSAQTVSLHLCKGSAACVPPFLLDHSRVSSHTQQYASMIVESHKLLVVP